MWLSVVPVDAPKYNTDDFFLIGINSSFFKIAAANLLLNGSQILYSMFVMVIVFSLYALIPGTKFFVAILDS